MTFIALIPKRAGIDNIKDFNPFSLIGIYKTLAKLLPGKLQKVLPCIISQVKSAFVHRKWIF